MLKKQQIHNVGSNGTTIKKMGNVGKGLRLEEIESSERNLDVFFSFLATEICR